MQQNIFLTEQKVKKISFKFSQASVCQIMHLLALTAANPQCALGAASLLVPLGVPTQILGPQGKFLESDHFNPSGDSLDLSCWEHPLHLKMGRPWAQVSPVENHSRHQSLGLGCQLRIGMLRGPGDRRNRLRPSNFRELLAVGRVLKAL